MFLSSIKREYAYNRIGISTENPLSSSIGMKTFLKGGNPIDVAVSISLTLSLSLPHLGGLGGDYFAIIKTPNDEVKVIMGSGQSSKYLTLENVRQTIDEDEWHSARGPLTPTVPGMIGALYQLWKTYGSLEWKDIVMQAEELARDGFPAPPAYSDAVKKNLRLLLRDPGSRETYLSNGVPEPGQKVKFKGLANLLEMISEDPLAFYDYDVSSKITAYVRNHGGVLSAEDFKEYSAYITDPVVLEDYHGWRIYEMPPNTQGITTLHMLEAIKESTNYDPLKRILQLIEISRKAYSIRDLYLGDPEYMEHSFDELLDDKFINKAPVLDKYTFEKCHPQIHGENKDTTMYSVASSDGWVITGIQSLFNHFGSGLTEPEYQVTLNNRSIGFTLTPNLPNTLGPGKRPLHTLSAVLAISEGYALTLGSSGGHYRPQQHALLLSSIIEHGYSIGSAIEAPRALWTPGTCSIISDVLLAGELLPPGYSNIVTRTGVANAVLLDNNEVWAATDPRGDGYPLGL